MRTTTRTLIAISLVLLAVIAVGFGVRLVRNDISLAQYRERLEQLSDDYETLRATYNDAVRRTAITELHVNRGQLCVRVRTVEGVNRTIETPFDPSEEIFVDYVIADGRVWIRRLYDANTAPANALVIDPAFAEMDWDDSETNVGKAIYRSLSEGRWVVTVTGDGSLGLAKAEDPSERAELVTAPEVRRYDAIEDEVNAELRRITPGDVWRALIGGR